MAGARDSAEAKAYDAEWKWLNSSEAKQRGAAAKALALSEFKKHFPYANMSLFQVQVEFDASRKALGRVLFPDGDGSWENPLIEDQKYWSPSLTSALGMQQDGGFPAQVSLLQSIKPPPHPVPTVSFSGSITQSVADIFNKEMKIYVTPTAYFIIKFRQIFTKTQITFTTAKYARKWLAKPDMSFWPQQLNFALWCATTGCGVSREMLFPNTSLKLSEQVRSFYQFHVYYTTRKLLYRMGGIQSKNALPDDPVFNQKDNPYDVAAYKSICAEFDIDPSTDFRYRKGANHGLGKVFINISRGGSVPTGMSYPSAKAKFGDEGGDPSEGNLAAFICNDEGADKQYEHFIPSSANGLTPIGLGRINQSIQAYCYSILGAQGNARKSIIGYSGSAKNAQLDFLILVEDAIKTLNVQNGPAKYQNSINNAMVRLNLAVARGALLLPARMIINTESVVGYNNKLKMSTADMKLGVNNQVNQDTKKAGLKKMAGGPSKINPPNSHPSNPVHKQATEAQSLATPATQPATPATQPTTPATPPAKPKLVDTHHANKALIAVGALALVGLIIYSSSS